MIGRILQKLVQYSNTVRLLTPKTVTPIQPTPIETSSNSSKNLEQGFISNATTSMDSTQIANYVNNDERTKALNICSEQLGGSWSKINLKDFSLVPISGGMSNSLFCCTLPDTLKVLDGEPNQVLLRFYGHEALNSDMNVQVEIFNLLSLKNLGPKLYGKFDEGRIEEFLPANSLTCNELMNQDISLIIAKKLAAVHCLDVPLKKDSNWLQERYNEFLSFIEQQGGLPEFSDSTRQTTKMIAKELLDINFHEEIKFVLGLCDRATSPIMFSHNDLHQGNILLAECSKRRPTLEERIVFIDFEYCSYNYRGYDIANHFSEWCFEYDTLEYPHFTFYQDRLPTEDVQRAFASSYLSHKNRLRAISSIKETIPISDDNNNNNTGDKKQDTHVLINGHTNASNGHSKEVECCVSEVDSLIDEIKPFFMSANLLWILWCIKSAYQSNIKFGYWEHAMARWQLYSNLKATFIKEMKAQINSETNL